MIASMLWLMLLAGADDGARAAAGLRELQPSLARAERCMAMVEATARMMAPREARWAAIARTLPYQQAHDAFEVHEGIRLFNARRAAFEADERTRPDHARIEAARARYIRECPGMGEIPDMMMTRR